MRKLTLILAFLLAGRAFAQQGIPVRSLNGSGPPNANLASVVGTEYIDISAGTLYVCTAVTLTPTVSSCTWTLGGGGSSTSVASLPFGNNVYVAQSCPATTPQCFVANVNVHVTTNATYTNTSQSVSTLSTDPAFVSGAFPAGDVGKIEFGAGNCPGTVSNCTYQVPQGTITAVNSAHNITVSIAATGTNSGTANANNFAWGSDDGPQLVLAFQALFPNTFTGASLIPEPSKALILPSGLMFTSVNPFITSSTTSSNGGAIRGVGPGSTVIIPLPKMNCSPTVVGTGCLFSDVVPNLENNGENLPGWHVADLTFWGLGTDVADAGATITSGSSGVYTNLFDELDNVWVVGWLWNMGATKIIYGLNNHTGSTFINSGSVAGGDIACTSTPSINAISLWIGGSCGGTGGTSANGAAFYNNGADNHELTVTEGVYFNQDLGGFTIDERNQQGVWMDHGSEFTAGGFLNAGANASTYFNGSSVGQYGGGSSALGISAGVVHLNNVFFAASGAPINQTGGTIYDDCGNGVLPGTAPVITNLYGACSITGVADVAGNHVLTSGWGTANVNTVTGSVNDVRFTISVTAGVPAASPV